ncbi:MAG: monovalent cation:proton antiporter-2 (CPA2) family protein [Gammaproteobacteria bacterium]|nr:monovalent cation:proton antiporter-2 (CPA2) family protein [Gammaproteobacteria bacterium]
MDLNPLLEILILLASAVLLVPLFQRLGLGSVLGFLTAGILVGPWGLGLITDVEAIQHLAEFGIVFLLFLIGIELKPSRLWRMRKMVFGYGLAQVLVTALVLGGLGRLAGLTPPVAILLGSAMALSSTAFVLQMLSERNELASHHGRLSFAILLLQDLAVVPLLALVPPLGSADRQIEVNVGFALLESAAIFAAVLLAGRFMLNPLFRHVAASHNSEVFTASALLLVLGTALLMEHAGLSMAMGAFIAGLLIADSEFRHQVVADIQPFRGLLLGLFFMSVGMAVDFGGLLSDWANVLLWLVVLLGVKAAILWPLALITGLRGASAAAVALFLAQGGEFGFVLFGVAHQAGVLDDLLFQRAILVVALSLALTPLLVRYADRLLVAEKRARQADIAGTQTTLPDSEETPRPVLIAGFGRVGRRIAELLQRANVPYVGIDQEIETVARARQRGFTVFFGDVSRPDVLRAADVGRARLAVVATDRGEPSMQAVRAIRREAPDLPILVRAVDRAHSRALIAAGATRSFSENLETSLQLAGAALRELGESPDTVQSLLDAFREEYAAAIRTREGG